VQWKSRSVRSKVDLCRQNLIANAPQFNYGSTMPYEMTVTAKGLVCIPQAIREHLDIQPGQTVIVDERFNEVVIRKFGKPKVRLIKNELGLPVFITDDPNAPILTSEDVKKALEDFP
jgi:AbrB family looped-hinge helix DNA binding protein